MLPLFSSGFGAISESRPPAIFSHADCSSWTAQTLYFMASKQRILVVDDEPSLLELVRLFLEKTQRFEVRLENRPNNVVAAAREFVPDLILLDIGMPGKDGGEVARELHEESATREIPILFFTSLICPTEAGEKETMRGGMHFLAKPVNARVLVESVDRVLASRRGHAMAFDSKLSKSTQESALPIQNAPPAPPLVACKDDTSKRRRRCETPA